MRYAAARGMRTSTRGSLFDQWGEEPSGLTDNAQQWKRSLSADNRTQAPHHSPCLRKATAGRDHLIEPLPSFSGARYIRCVFWLTRPPYLRWAAAAAVVVFAFLWDLRGSSDMLYPFASNAIAAGAPITETVVDWRRVPEGTMPLPDLSSPVAARDLPAGEPIVPSAVAGATTIPDGWWSVPVTLPAAAVPGTTARLIDAASGFEIDGVVVAPGSDDLMSFDDSGLVAVPPDAASLIAIAAREGTLVVLLAS